MHGHSFLGSLHSFSRRVQPSRIESNRIESILIVTMVDNDQHELDEEDAIKQVMPRMFMCRLDHILSCHVMSCPPCASRIWRERLVGVADCPSRLANHYHAHQRNMQVGW